MLQEPAGNLSCLNSFASAVGASWAAGLGAEWQRVEVAERSGCTMSGLPHSTFLQQFLHIRKS